MPDKLHIIISVRDFRAILQHANWTSSELNAAYSRPGRPMKISYSGDGIACEFILMTVDEKSTTSAQKKGKAQAAAKAARPALDAASSSRPASEAESRARKSSPSQQQQQQQPPQHRSQMPPPPRPTVPRSSQFDIRAPTKQPPSTLKSDSLFLPQPDDDDQWAPVNPDEDEDEGENARLEWGASNEPVSGLELVFISDWADAGFRLRQCALAITPTTSRGILWRNQASICHRHWSPRRGWTMYASLVSSQARRFCLGDICMMADNLLGVAVLLSCYTLETCCKTCGPV